MNTRQVVFCIVLAAVLLASQGLLRRPAPDRAPPPPADRGYYVIDGTLRGLAEDGAAFIEINVDRAEQQPALARVALEEVDVTYLDREAMPWRMRAEAGHITQDWRLLELRGRVRLEGLDDSGQPLALLTDHLTVMVGERRALTQSRVRIETSHGVITARGMTADLTTQRFRLEADVRGRFVAQTEAR